MFPTVEAFGKKIDRGYAERRSRWERLYEVTQMKGDGEAHPFLSKNDEFADFEDGCAHGTGAVGGWRAILADFAVPGPRSCGRAVAAFFLDVSQEVKNQRSVDLLKANL